MKSIAIIPARSGSKGLVDKNIIELNGKPLIYYTIKAAMKSKCFDEVMVSTDSEKYAAIAKECGAKVPFLRSTVNSGDGAGSWDTVREVLAQYDDMGYGFNYVTLLQPTSPLRTSEDIKGAFDVLKKEYVNNVVSVSEVSHPVQWCFRLGEGNSMEEMASSPYSYMRRQDLDKHYLENGAIYIIDAKKILSIDYNFYEDNCYAYIMDKEKSVDIDDYTDLLIASAIMNSTNSEVC